jgi:hypothetical protein
MMSTAKELLRKTLDVELCLPVEASNGPGRQAAIESLETSSPEERLDMALHGLMIWSAVVREVVARGEPPTEQHALAAAGAREMLRVYCAATIAAMRELRS